MKTFTRNIMHLRKTRTYLTLAALACLSAMTAAPVPPAAAPLVKPTPEQVAWQDLELGMFYHFDINVFTDAGEGAWQNQGGLKPTLINHAIFMEKITEGERIREYTLEAFTGGAWKELCKGQSVGHKRIEQFGDVTVSKVRLRVTRSIAKPLLRTLAVYHVTTAEGTPIQ